MNKYEIRVTKSNDKSFTPLTGSACGETFDLAIEHANFWEKDGHWIDPDCQIEILSVTPIDYYPYTYEDAFRFAVENKIKVINAIANHQRTADFDKLDLIKVIVNESPAEYIHLDTACRDALVDIINEDICDDIIELIMEFTEPYKDLTEEEAGQIMSDMEANGYTLPIGFTPKDFVELYHECEPEDDEEGEE